MDSLVSIRDYIQRAKEMGYQQIGLMDIDNLYGAYEFFRRVPKKASIGAVLGLDLEVELPGALVYSFACIRYRRL